MSAAKRHTAVVHGRLAMQELRLQAARESSHGLQVMTFEQLAARLAGGFSKPIDGDSLRLAIKDALPNTPMGELEQIKSLPGMIGAAADTLQKAWLANIDLKAEASHHPRLAAMARLEDQILKTLPAGMSRPADLVREAINRIDKAPAIFGSIEIHGMTELSPCWRSLLLALKTVLPVSWNAGPRKTPAWLSDDGISILRREALKPDISVVSAATTYHEAMEAMRWARSLLASGRAKSSEIAIAATSPADYDDHFISLRADANLDIHFVHGVRVVTTRPGQAAAALADIVKRGLSQSRFRRLTTLCKDAKVFSTLPEGWRRILPSDAPLGSVEAWERLLNGLEPKDWPDGQDHSQTLRNLIRLLSRGPDAAQEMGEALLDGLGLTIWRKALAAGPAASIDTTLEKLKQDDGLESCACVAWMPASALAASPRKFVRLLGLNSSRWPRGIVEDRLIPDHIIRTSVLDPLPVNMADQRDFDTITRTTAGEIVLSRARRDNEGRLLGKSPLLTGRGDETYLRRNAIPAHAYSESDRLMARADEFVRDPQGKSARECWIDWRRQEITPHDGLVRPDHPLIQAILARIQSASSLKRLLRNPLGFVWVYAFGWRAPQDNAEPLVLDPLGLGDLVHLVLELALRDLERAGGLASATDAAIAAATEKAVQEIATDWELKRPIPPKLIWRRTLDDVVSWSGIALSYGADREEGGRSYGEVPFGGSKQKVDGDFPWDPGVPVTIPETGFNIAGFIDRLDISRDGKKATVRDYKTGKPSKGDKQLNGGQELQRCLYAFAVKSLLGNDVSISASLFYPRANLDQPLRDPEATLTEITRYLRVARESLAKGAAVPGPDAGSNYDDLDFALPANAKAIYSKRKAPAVKQLLGELTQVWEAE